MICEHCKTEHPPIRDEYDQAEAIGDAVFCRDALRERAEAAVERNAALEGTRDSEIAFFQQENDTLRAEVERLRDAIQMELSQRSVDDSYGRDKSACRTVSDILERRGADFGLAAALSATPPEAQEPEIKWRCSQCGAVVLAKDAHHHGGCGADADRSHRWTADAPPRDAPKSEEQARHLAPADALNGNLEAPPSPGTSDEAEPMSEADMQAWSDFLTHCGSPEDFRIFIRARDVAAETRGWEQAVCACAKRIERDGYYDHAFLWETLLNLARPTTEAGDK